MKVYLNDKDGKRKVVEVELVKERDHTVRVKLPDGNIITRKTKRDVVEA